MEGQVDISLLFNEERKRVYIGVKADIVKGTIEEKEELRRKLMAGLGYVLGLEYPPLQEPPENTGKDFEQGGSLPSEVAEQFTVAQPGQTADETQTGTGEDASQPAAQPAPKIGFGGRRFQAFTAQEIIEREGNAGATWLENVALPAIKRQLNNPRYPENKAKLDSVKRALAEFRKSGTGSSDEGK